MITVVLLFVLGLVLICLGGDRLVDAAVAIARKIGIPQIVVGATIVSIGTTLPEVLVSTTAAFDGSVAITAGNAFGSIICNTALIAGVAQTIRPSRKVETKALVWRACFFFAVILSMTAIGWMTGEFGRLTGLALIVLFAVYAVLNIKRAKVEGGEEEDTDEEELKNISVVKNLLVLAACAVMLFIGARLLVNNGIIIAEFLGVPERVIAVTFIALGTSLPELVTSIMSLVKGYENVGLGNIIGANILNLLLVIGIPGAIAGIPLEAGTYQIDMPLGILLMAILLVPIMIRKKGSRVQGIALLGIYAVYCLFSFAA